jgi:2-polyprenyl-3-methyl-5-hydroxy-6-metoxy-1,4-benzoquinol methylase
MRTLPRSEMTRVRQDAHAEEVAAGRRFTFGRNWARFLSVLDQSRVQEAERSLMEMLGCTGLEGRTFLDVGSGSGLFSLAARRLGARVRSFDFDPQSVACTEELKRRFFPDDSLWEIQQGSILDAEFVGALPQFDVVYSWGVLHHTGDMWQGLRNVLALVKPGGLLFIALYNDQGVWSRLWGGVKRMYCAGWLGRGAAVGLSVPYLAARQFLGDVLRGRKPTARYSEYYRNRGMSLIHDWIDWVGGYPFEVAAPGDVFEFYRGQGFRLERMITTPSLGNNEFVFRRLTEERS